MNKLADIGDFEALSSLASEQGSDANALSVFNAISTENGKLSNYIGYKLARNYILDPNRSIPNKDSVRYRNYKAAIDRGKEAADWLRENRERLNKNAETNEKGRWEWQEWAPEVIEKGFRGFANLCANFDFDVSDILNKLNIVFYAGPVRSYSRDSDLEIGIAPEKGLAGVIPHELTHLLFRCPEVRESIKEKINFPWRMGEREDKMNHQTFPQDRLRAWLAGDDYVGKEYHFDGDEFDYNSEYLPMLFDSYGENKIPMFYALDLMRLIKKINKKSKKNKEKKTD